MNPFKPDSSSTPGPSGEDIPLTTMNREREKEPTSAETSFIEGSSVSRVLISNRGAWEALKGIFPEAKATEIVFLTVKREVTGEDVWSRKEGL